VPLVCFDPLSTFRRIRRTTLPASSRLVDAFLVVIVTLSPKHLVFLVARPLDVAKDARALTNRRVVVVPGPLASAG